MSNVQDTVYLIDDLIQNEEGGWKLTYIDGDRGGMTYGGMPYNTYVDTMRKYDLERFAYGPDEFLLLAKNDDEALQDRVRLIYQKEFLDKCETNSLPFLLARAVFSCAVNCGVKRSVKLLQKTINQITTGDKLIVDGIIGNKTIQASQRFYSQSLGNLVNVYVSNWQIYYLDICINDPTQLKFIKGWYSRADKYRIRY